MMLGHLSLPELLQQPYYFHPGGSFPEYIPILYTACLQILIHITKKSKKATNKNKQLNVLTFY